MAGNVSFAPIPKVRINPANRMDIELGNGIKVDPEKISAMVLPPGQKKSYDILLKSGDKIKMNGDIKPEYVQASWNEARESLKHPGNLDLFA